MHAKWNIINKNIKLYFYNIKNTTEWLTIHIRPQLSIMIKASKTVRTIQKIVYNNLYAAQY